MTRFLLLLLLVATPAAAQGRAQDRAAFAITPHPGASLPIDMPLLGEHGPTSLRTLARGRPTLLVLGYFRCPNLCGVIRDDVFSALARAATDSAGYALAFVTIDPAETPADAAAARAGAVDRYPDAARASFLTGDAAPLAAAAGFPSRWDQAENQFLHPAGLVILTQAGTVSGYIEGVGYEPAAIDRALAAAAANIVSAPASPILLLCFHYDEATGRYTLAITKVLRLVSGLTALGLVAALAVAHRRKRPA